MGGRQRGLRTQGFMSPRILGAATGVVLAVAAATPAVAGTYLVHACRTPSGAVAPADRWSGAIAGAYMYYGNACAQGGGLNLAADGRVAHARGSLAAWDFSPPADTRIARVALMGSGTVPGSDPGRWSWMFTVGLDGGVSELCYGIWGCNPQRWFDTGWADGGHFRAQLACDPAPGADCPAGVEAAVGIAHAQVWLTDATAPALAGAPGGSLLRGGPQSGRRTLTWGATDRGGGVREARLEVDGHTVARDVRCGEPFTATRPCPASVSGVFEWDTATVDDGLHRVRMLLVDAGGEAVAWGPEDVVVENVPPPAATAPPEVEGEPDPGLSIGSTDGTWTGRELRLTRRWQRSTDTGWADIAGATERRYRVAAADVGRQLRVVVVAENREGRGEAASAPTATVPARAAVERAGDAGGGVPPAPPAGRSPQGEFVEPAAHRISGVPRTRTVAYGRPVVVRGRILDRSGRARGGVRVELAGTGIWGASASDGHFALRLPPGRSRRLLVRAERAHDHPLVLRVRARVTLRARPVRVAPAGRVRLSGWVAGVARSSRKVVELQVRLGGRWTTFASVRLRRGRFVHGHRFLPTTRSERFSFRARVRTEAGFPYATGASKAVSVRVR